MNRYFLEKCDIYNEWYRYLCGLLSYSTYFSLTYCINKRTGKMPIRQKLFYNKLGKYINREKIIYNATGIDIFDKKYKYLKVNYKHDDRIDDPFYLLFIFADLKSLWKFRIPSKPINLSFYNRHRKLFESNTMIRDNTVYLSETEYYNECKYSGYDINLTEKDLKV